MGAAFSVQFNIFPQSFRIESVFLHISMEKMTSKDANICIEVTHICTHLSSAVLVTLFVHGSMQSMCIRMDIIYSQYGKYFKWNSLLNKIFAKNRVLTYLYAECRYLVKK